MGCFVDDLVYFGTANRSKNQKHRYYIPQGWWSMIQMRLVIQIGTARPSPFLDNTLPSGAPDEMEGLPLLMFFLVFTFGKGFNLT